MEPVAVGRVLLFLPLLAFLFVCFIGLSLAQTEDQCGSVYCPDDCNGRAPTCKECVKTTCECIHGYSGDDCSESVARTIPGAWYTLRIFFVLAFGLCGLVGVLAYLNQSSKRSISASSSETDARHDFSILFFNARKGVLITLIVICFDSLLYYAIDPQGFEGILPFVVVQLLYGVVFYGLSILYTLVIFHWAEVYYTTVKTLKREEMLEKINSKYHSEVTLDQVLSNIKFLDKLKIPFITINVVAVIVQLLRDFMLGITLEPLNVVNYFWSTFYFALYAVESIGFMFYGKKLVSVLPSPLRVKMKKVTLTIVVTSLLFLVSFCVSATAFWFYVDGGWSYLIADTVWRLMLLIIVMCVLSLFVRVQRAFPWFNFTLSKKSKSSQSFEDTTTKEKTSQGENEENKKRMELETSEETEVSSSSSDEE